MENKHDETRANELFTLVVNLLATAVIFLVSVVLSLAPAFFFDDQWEQFSKSFSGSEKKEKKEQYATSNGNEAYYWIAPNPHKIEHEKQRRQVLYGRELIVHTSKYLGPKGTVKAISNGLNCQNCHLSAGTAIFGNNYGSVAATYPKFRARSGIKEDIYKRVNDCFERSLNGQPLDTAGNEMQAIKAYIEFLGGNMPKGEKAHGSGLKDLPYLDRAADPVKGKLVYESLCQSCHQAGGEGILTNAGTEFLYPALWGKNSYNDGAGLYRISNFAKYAKYNMPLGVNFTAPQLSDEAAWDVAAYVNSQKRPHIEVPGDWPDISQKPVDHPFGPYADNFSELQHKYGPFKPIEAMKKAQENSAKMTSANQ
ncbi:MAG: c-type cytochrome [Saprospiraceae bacterium]|nr:c-type cytochrome [Saprospiraceae bacterium]MDZ4704827.1 c-type cytochrome [Saprospiraceae bacterium]